MANEKHLEILRSGVEAWNQWRKDHPDIEPDLENVNLDGTNLRGVRLYNTNLNFANLNGADLRHANLYGANLYGIDLRHAHLDNADLNFAHPYGANLEGASLKHSSLKQANLKQANLNQANLEQANLHGADLSHANLNSTNLEQANLRSADLSFAQLNNAYLGGVDLYKVQALNSSFVGAVLTSACIEDWNINSQTNLEDVDCDYIYLKRQYSPEKRDLIFSDRRPHDPNKIFAPGEFTKLFQKALETVDLLFQNGVDWQAVAYSLKNIQVLNEDTPLAIQKIENKGDGDVLISVSVPENVDKGKFEGNFWQGYEFAQKALEGQFQARIDDKDKEINRLFSIVNDQSQQLGEAQKLLAEANKTINVGKNYNENLQGNYYEQNGKFGIGHNEGDISGEPTVGGEINEAGQKDPE